MKQLLIALLFISSNTFAAEINWNDKNLKWYNYDQGINEIKKTGKPGLFIIYADWCYDL